MRIPNQGEEWAQKGGLFRCAVCAREYYKEQAVGRIQPVWPPTGFLSYACMGDCYDIQVAQLTLESLQNPGIG